MWNWIKKQAIRAFRFSKELINYLGNLLVDRVETLVVKIAKYCEGSNLRKFVVGISLITAVCVASAYMSGAITLVTASMMVFSIVMSAIEKCFKANSVVDVGFTLLVSTGKALLAVGMSIAVPHVILLSGSILIAEALRSWYVEYSVSSSARRKHAPSDGMQAVAA